MLRKLALATAAVAVFATAAFAAVTVNADGTGFVGKGDVQNAFGWNNALLQRHAEEVSFSYDETVVYGFECEWWTGPTHNLSYHTVDATKTGSIQSAVDYDARRRNQLNGFILNGWDGDPVVTGGGDLPGIGDPCPGNQGSGKTVSEVYGELSATGGLYVTFEDDTVLLD